MSSCTRTVASGSVRLRMSSATSQRTCFTSAMIMLLALFGQVLREFIEGVLGVLFDLVQLGKQLFCLHGCSVL